jgi:hypothetical protein
MPPTSRQGTLYATVAIFIAGIQVIFVRTPGLTTGGGTLLAIVVGAALRLLACWRNWKLPRRLEWKISPRAQLSAADRSRQDRERAGSIMAGVGLDTIKQIRSQLEQHSYRGFLH